MLVVLIFYIYSFSDLHKQFYHALFTVLFTFPVIYKSSLSVFKLSFFSGWPKLECQKRLYSPSRYLEIHPGFVSGLIDAEGCFSVVIAKDIKRRTG